ncbi:hypothetical protein HSACCH_02073 [Halanaerobium saccharolyticum subsp. saccharolyticum DSM 6643]|uniref:Uncharacterized protein n=1 Tax=Halanaerobium saccharolyticum subsp. saccharolyticum DSM 6643 TaxID=1293054 RepID=M5E2V9_9FIRM|nr:hypothetical protein [Halanaerobium saccharolyticum]CCU80483.1 hypothetical protein HSACCH_02073 [Halanaerobium saccharolyticum subsp. saccharolyticum DSM 6643]
MVNINVDLLIKNLKEIEKNYRMDNNKLNFNNGFADGILRSIEEIEKIAEQNND